MSRWCWVLLVLISVVQGTSSVFAEEPSPAVVAENDTAVFRCRVSSGAQAWAVNGTFTSSQRNPDIDTDSEPAPDGGPPIETLSIVARQVYNGTTVQCFVFPDSINSRATLLIQGPLSAVPELAATPQTDSILFSWAAPFSLNLTNTEPNITYCVDVFTSEGTELVASGCGLTETSYNFTAEMSSPCDVFIAVVTPVNGAGNGSTTSVDIIYFFSAPVILSPPSVTVAFDERQTLGIAIVDFQTVVHVSTSDVLIISNDRNSPAVNSTIHQTINPSPQVLVFPLSTADVPLNRIYTLEVVLRNSAGSITTAPLRFSTHDVQDVRATPLSSSPSVVEINVTFAAMSRALGSVVVVKSASLEVVFVNYRQVDCTTDGFTITGLPPASYDTAAFDLELTSQLPGRYAAVRTSFQSINQSNVPLAADGAVMAEAVQRTRDTCVDCTIPATVNATECVVITHPTGSLDEIEMFVLINGEVNCLQGSTNSAYFIASFGRRNGEIVSLSTEGTIIATEENSPPVNSTLIAAVVPVLAVVTILVLALVLIAIICICKFKRSTKSASTIQVEPNSAYEFRKIRHRLAATNTTQPPPATGGGGSVEMNTIVAHASHSATLPPTRAIAEPATRDSPPHAYETVN